MDDLPKQDDPQQDTAIDIQSDANQTVVMDLRRPSTLSMVALRTRFLNILVRT